VILGKKPSSRRWTRAPPVQSFLAPPAADRGTTRRCGWRLIVVLADRTRGFRVIPVLLPGANPADPNTLPRFTGPHDVGWTSEAGWTMPRRFVAWWRASEALHLAPAHRNARYRHGPDVGQPGETKLDSAPGEAVAEREKVAGQMQEIEGRLNALTDHRSREELPCQSQWHATMCSSPTTAPTNRPSRSLRARLIEAGLQPFLDRWHLIPGEPWMEALESALAESASVAVFVGPSASARGTTRDARGA